MALPLTVLVLLTVLAIAAAAIFGEYQMGQREAGRERQTYSVQCTARLATRDEGRGMAGAVSQCMLLHTLTYCTVHSVPFSRGIALPSIACVV